MTVPGTRLLPVPASWRSLAAALAMCAALAVTDAAMAQFGMVQERGLNTGVGTSSQRSTTQGYQRAQAFRAGAAWAATP